MATEEKPKKKTGRPKGSKSSYTVSEKAIAQRRKANPVKREPVPPEDYEYNAKTIEHIMMIHEIAQHADKKDPASLKACFINYLILCQRNGFKVGNMAACTAMGITRFTLDAWSKSTDRPEYKELADFVRSTCSLFREQAVADQKINPVIGIFWQRNYDGLRNDTEQQQSIAEQREEDNPMTAQDYAKKYGKLLEE